MAIISGEAKMKKLIPALIVLAGVPNVALAQSNDPPPATEGGAGSNLPDVQIIQEQQAAPQPATPKPAAAKPKPKPRPVQQQASSPPPLPPQDDEFEAIAEISEPAQILANSPYGATAGARAAERAQFGSINPINARQILPGDLQNYAGSGARVSTTDLDKQRPLTTHEALARVPGVVSVLDDGIGRHGGISIRGAPFRRSRKVLVMEDGQPINFAPYLDSSSHYTPPLERVESIEVLKGNVVNYGPLNNFGVVNFRNLSPFGANETLMKFGFGTTEGSDRDWNNFRHVHTRQNLGNVGVVASYSGSETGGAWDNEVLRYNDFYGAIGFKGSNQDLTVSGGFHRQRDVYDETNFEGTADQFFRNRRNKDGIDDDLAGFFDDSSYNGDHYRLQVAHNYYFDKDTTLTTRLYGADHERARFYPDGLVEEGEPEEGEVIFEGRDRRYRNYGVDSRIEFANLQLFNGMTHDFQSGISYREEKFSNTNRIGEPGEILDFNDRGGVDSQAKLDASAFSAFMQTAVRVTPNLTITPGVRFESYDVDFRETVDGDAVGQSDHDHVLPSIAFAWEAMPRSTFYGGYHRGLTPHIVRDAQGNDNAFPLPEEIGDNFQLGVRSTAFTGLTLDMAVFHSQIENYQFKEAEPDPASGLNLFGVLDEVELSGFEIYGRLDSRPFHRGPWNFFGEAVYTYVDGDIKKGTDFDEEAGLDVDVSGNRIPESIRHFANLTLGIEHQAGWDLSVSWNYRGDFHTDSLNTSYADADLVDGEVGLVPDVWLVSARGNYKVNDQLSLFISGQNLTNEFYISDRSDGIKAGIGRTIFGGFTLKFDH
jgi:Fe(3+) dicitrate transport protein